MLKIKENIDLKELEKYGFYHEKEEDENDVFDLYEYNCLDNRTYVQVYSDDRIIVLHSGVYGDYPEYYHKKTLDILFDLIQAGLVEKVENE